MQLDMTKGKPLPLMTKFMIPVVIGNIFQQLYNMVDTMIVGRFVGVDALAAVGATGSVVFLILGFATGLTTGFTVMTAQRFGAADPEGMKKSLGSAALLSAIAVVLLTIISLAGMNPLLHLMNTPENILDMSRTYLSIICSGMCFTVLYNLLASIMRAIGNSLVPLILLIISSVTNIALDLLFVITFHMGVGGAAYATIISQALSGVLCLIYILWKVPILHMEKRHWKPDHQTVRNQLAVGVPMALQFSITAVGVIIVQGALNLLGSLTVASYSVSGKIEMLASQPFAAMGVTVATYSAQNRGINDLERIKEGVKIANIIAGIYALVIYGLTNLLLPLLVRLFVTEDVATVTGLARTYLVINGALFIPLGMIFIFRNALQGCGLGFWPMMGGVVELICRCVIAFWAAERRSYIGVCLSDGLTWLITAVFLIVIYFITMKKMQKTKLKSIALKSN
jgi:putative MATE family efflux protein